MKNVNLIYAATDAAANFSKAANHISCILTRYLDEGNGKYSEEEAINKIKNEIKDCITWAEEIFDGILSDGVNP